MIGNKIMSFEEYLWYLNRAEILKAEKEGRELTKAERKGLSGSAIDIIELGGYKRDADGKLMKDNDGNYIKTEIPKAELNKVIENYKGDLADAQAQFETFKEANDMFLYEDGELKFNPRYIKAKAKDGKWYNELGDEISQEEAMREVYTEYSEFRLKVQGVNHKIHGVYNKSDRGRIEQNMYGQLLMQYKHWMRAGWTRRFGGNGFFNMKADFNVRRNEWSRGSYKTLLHYLGSPLRSGALSEFDDKHGFALTIHKQFRGMRELVANYKRYWYAMNKWERQEASRALADMVIILTVFTLYSMLRNPDDDELKKNRAYAFAVYTLSGLFTEVAAFSPIGLYQEGKKLLKAPMSILPNIENAIGLVYDLLAYPFRSDKERVYRTGQYHRQSKIEIKASKLIPGFIPLSPLGLKGAQGVRWEYLDANDKAYYSK
jgi:hypothetical protein